MQTFRHHTASFFKIRAPHFDKASIRLRQTMHLLLPKRLAEKQPHQYRMVLSHQHKVLFLMIRHHSMLVQIATMPLTVKQLPQTVEKNRNHLLFEKTVSHNRLK